VRPRRQLFDARAGAVARRRLAGHAALTDTAGTVGAVPTTTEEMIMVASVKSHGPLSVTIRAVQTGVTVSITDGVAMYHDVSDASNPFHAPLCIAKVSCAAVSVRADVAQQLTLAALTDIANAGLAVQPAMMGWWTSLTGSNSTPWAQPVEGRRMQESTITLCSDECLSSGERGWNNLEEFYFGPSNGQCEDGGVGYKSGSWGLECPFGSDCTDCGPRVVGCGRYQDKRRIWCEAGWVRMRGMLETRLERIWGEDFNVFYAYGAIVVATDWWQTPDKSMMLPLYASWKWYTPDYPDAFACAIAFQEHDLFASTGLQTAMYGVNKECANEQRNNYMVQAADCIERNFQGECWWEGPRDPGDGVRNMGTDVDKYQCKDAVYRVDSVTSWDATQWRASTNYYFTHVGTGSDPCETELKVRAEMATKQVLQGASCVAHDPYGGDPFPIVGGAPYQGPSIGYHGSVSFNAATFWDGSSEANYDVSQVYGTELPGFEGFGFTDGQGSRSSREKSCPSTFDLGWGYQGQKVFGHMGFPSYPCDKLAYVGGLLTNINLCTDEVRSNYSGVISDQNSQQINALTEAWVRPKNDLFPNSESRGVELLLFFPVEPSEPPLASDVWLWYPAYLGRSKDRPPGRYRKGMTQSEYFALYDQHENCMQEAAQFQAVCDHIEFTRSVWLGSASVTGEPGWECISDLEDYTTTLPWPPPPPPPSTPIALSPLSPPSPSSPAPLCMEDCVFSADGLCDDGGAGSQYSDCEFGTDCFDCGSRSGNPLCMEDCVYPSDGLCDDGGPGSLYSICKFGTDCTDCGSRNAGGGGRQLDEGALTKGASSALDGIGDPKDEDVSDEERRKLEVEEVQVNKDFEEAMAHHQRRHLGHGCANAASGCLVLGPPRR